MSSERLLNIPVYDKSTALDIIFSFLQIAQRRGAYSFPESAKIFECMQQFQDFFNHPSSENNDENNETNNENNDENNETNNKENNESNKKLDNETFDSDDED